jgi:hypothetical protein
MMDAGLIVVIALVALLVVLVVALFRKPRQKVNAMARQPHTEESARRYERDIEVFQNPPKRERRQ